MKINDIKIVLASGSPRRIEMMRAHGLEPIVHPASIEENLPLEHGMRETVMYLALKKGMAVKSELIEEGAVPEGDGLIISADTIVYFGDEKTGEIMGKPADFDDAFRMLSKLRNTHHYVATGVSLVSTNTNLKKVFCEVTEVHFKDYTDEELKSYLSTNEAYDKAGGYAIQGYFKKYIDHFEGDYDNVVGFPWARIEKEIEKL